MVDYRGPAPPPGTLRRWLWEKRIALETSTGLAMLSRREEYVILSICLCVTLIFWVSVFNYLPGHVAYLARRLSYYLYGDEMAPIFGMGTWAWWEVVKRELGLVGKLYKGIWEDRFGWESMMVNKGPGGVPSRVGTGVGGAGAGAGAGTGKTEL